MKRRKTIVSIFVVAIVYFFILPASWAWLEPEAEIHIPGEWAYDEDLPVEFTLSAWHSNYEIVLVRFHPDYHESELRGEPEPMYPQPLIQGERRNQWSAVTLNRFTWPRSERHDLTVPLAELADQNRSAPGTLRGHVEITIHFVVRPSGGGHGNRARRMTERVPFELTLN